MIVYLDTSLVVSIIVAETSTETAQHWLVAHGDAPLLISDWVTTEVSAALAGKVRTGAITREAQTAAAALFRHLVRDRFTGTSVTATDFRAAARFAEDPAAALKAGDALHLAIAAQHGATVYTFDRQQAAAGPVVGVPTILLA